MNQENFITGSPNSIHVSRWLISLPPVGYPGREFQIRDALDEVLGPEKAAFYWDKVEINIEVEQLG